MMDSLISAPPTGLSVDYTPARNRDTASFPKGLDAESGHKVISMALSSAGVPGGRPAHQPSDSILSPPPGLCSPGFRPPTAYAVGCTLAPLRGFTNVM